MVAAAGEHHQRLGQTVLRGATQHQLAQALGQLGAARLARLHQLAAAGAQAFGQTRQVRALAGAVDAFDGDELRGFVRHLVEESW